MLIHIPGNTMVKPPEYEAMDEARVFEVPRAFQQVFGKDSGFELEKEEPRRDPNPPAGPREFSTYHVMKGNERIATIHYNGHISCLDPDIQDKMDQISEILEKHANEAYRRVKSGGY